MPRAFDLDDVVALLASGKNVVTTRGELVAGGARLDADGARRACWTRARGATRRSTRPGAAPGSSPTRCRSRCSRSSAASTRSRSRSSPTSPDATRRSCCSSSWASAGRSTRTTRAGRSTSWASSRPRWRSSPATADRPVDDWTCGGEVAAARRDHDPRGRRAAGRDDRRAAHHDRRVGATASEVVRFTANWYCTTELEPAWDLRPTGWRVRVRGDAPLDGGAAVRRAARRARRRSRPATRRTGR